MNTAHNHAANAEEYHAQGLLLLAEAEHENAARAFASAIENSNDESAKRTLRLLHNEHIKAAKDLQRRIDKLKQEGKDPALPQPPHVPKPQAPSRHHSAAPQVGPPRINTGSPQPIGPPLTDSNTGDESFMLLGGQRSDPGDAFNQFWNIMQGMLDNLSQPVAFATVPLGNPDTPTTPPLEKPSQLPRDGNLSSDTDLDEPIFSKFTRKIGIARDGSWAGRSLIPGHSKTPSQSVHNDVGFEDDDDFLEDGDDLSGSFFVVPTGAENSPAALKKENTSLKAEVASMKARLEATEKVLKFRKEQDVHLRDSIYQASREAQRVMSASNVLHRPPPALDFSSLNINPSAVPIPGIGTGREAQYARRVKELEEELRLMKVENEKNKLMIAKFRERWEKLKDSAKRKKEAKAAAEASKGVGERIVEEPEAEEELDVQ